MDGSNELRELTAGVLEDRNGGFIPGLRNARHLGRQACNSGARPLGRVKEVEDFVCSPDACGLEEHLEQARCRTPAFLQSHCGADRLLDDPESAAFITEDVAPTSSAHRTITPASEGDRAGAADRDDPIGSGDGSRERDQSVMRNKPLLGYDDLAKNGVLIFRPAAHSEACRPEVDVVAESGCGSGIADALENGSAKLRTRLARRHVVAWAGSSPPEDPAGRIAYNGFRARLAAVNTEVEFQILTLQDRFQMLHFRCAQHLINVQQDLDGALHLGNAQQIRRSDAMAEVRCILNVRR